MISKFPAPLFHRGLFIFEPYRARIMFRMIIALHKTPLQKTSSKAIKQWEVRKIIAAGGSLQQKNKKPL